MSTSLFRAWVDHLISVVVGAPSLASHLPIGPVLVIDAKASRFEVLRASGADDLSCAEAVLTEQTDELVQWHCYADHRLDGVLPVDQLRTVFPNITEPEIVTFSGQRLDGLLDAWQQELTSFRATTPLLQLIVRQGSPLAALGGLGLWERRLQRVRLIGFAADQLWRPVLESWLHERGFASVADQPFAWERDPLVLSRLECQELILERNQMERRVMDLENRMAHINQELDEITAMLDGSEYLVAATPEGSS
jgi:hypothetical protein